MFGTDTGKYKKPVSITKSLYKLLIELGYETKKDSSSYILERDEMASLIYLKNALTKGFSHFIKFVTDREICFSDLRKTYISHLSLKLGNKAKIFTGHSNDQIMRDHYIAEELMVANLDNLDLFDESSEGKTQQTPHPNSAPE